MTENKTKRAERIALVEIVRASKRTEVRSCRLDGVDGRRAGASPATCACSPLSPARNGLQVSLEIQPRDQTADLRYTKAKDQERRANKRKGVNGWAGGILVLWRQLRTHLQLHLGVAGNRVAMN
jgi:hypothetical protein